MDVFAGFWVAQYTGTAAADLLLTVLAPVLGSSAIASIACVVGILLGVTVEQLIGYVIDCAQPKAPDRPTGPIIPRCMLMVSHGQPLISHGQPLVSHGQPMTSHGQPLLSRGQLVTSYGQSLPSSPSLPRQGGAYHQADLTTVNLRINTLQYDFRECVE